MMPENGAAWLTTARTRPLKVAEAPYNPPGPDEVVIRTKAGAINTVD